MRNKFLIIEHDAHADHSPSMMVVDEEKASNRFDQADYLDGEFTIMYLHDDNKLYEVELREPEEKFERSENSIIRAISEMWIEDRHTFGQAMIGHCQHTDH